MRTGNCDRLKKTQTLFYGGNMKKIALITYFPHAIPTKVANYVERVKEQLKKENISVSMGV